MNKKEEKFYDSLVNALIKTNFETPDDELEAVNILSLIKNYINKGKNTFTCDNDVTGEPMNRKLINVLRNSGVQVFEHDGYMDECGINRPVWYTLKWEKMKDNILKTASFYRNVAEMSPKSPINRLINNITEKIDEASHEGHNQYTHYVWAYDEIVDITKVIDIFVNKGFKAEYHSHKYADPNVSAIGEINIEW